MNLLEQLRTGTADIRRSLESILAAGYRERDVGRAARDASALWETTLKATGRSWSGNYLFDQTRDLSSLGWTGGPDLDLVRKTNNQAKHGLTLSVTGEEVLAALSKLEEKVAALQPLIPELQNEVVERRLRRMICAIYDNFAHGDTEFAFLEATPMDTWMTVRRIDEFQVSSAKEEQVRSELEQLSGWEYDPPAFAGLRASLQESDTELWRIAVLTATYEEAQEIVIRYQHDFPLLRGLHRDDYVGNVLTSFALVQARRLATAGTLLSPEDLLVVALHAGLVARRSDLLDLARAITDLLEEASPHTMTVSVDRANGHVFEQELARSPMATNVHYGLLVSREGMLFVRSG